ncbi:hypothetical protein P22_1380 [Propionispora sp. 2/2-37]|uniref:4'-phosphopantetheinyl transferase family protein n=1 Tax=Propionispora sp. 2/2-37 TaxID=1677858 RepID=UPI0006BB7F0D|nr:4'-phosphopantetheinyl transferase superfamily protein [Propionispora sp. 2/2-37]CUH95310.1 hypothetical protein P22_1380 [Propionispora sp. 2/2-37]
MFKLKIRNFDREFAAASFLLSGGDIHLWLAFIQTFEARGEQLEALLSAEETSRMERFHFPKDRIGFAVTHGILRMLIGRYLNFPPHLLTFQPGRYGKPELYGNKPVEHFFFNLSHSCNLAAFAFSRSYPLGVDVEHIRDIGELNETANYCFHQKERAAFKALPADKRLNRFFECWTCKEAFVKATGEGFSRSPDSFYFYGDNCRAKDIFCIKGAGINSAEWEILTFKPAADYAGAVAFRKQDHVLQA